MNTGQPRGATGPAKGIVHPTATFNTGQPANATGPPKGSAARAPLTAAPQPQDPGFENQKLQAGRNVALGNSEAAYQTGNLGFDAGYNPDGTVNTANPYSRAALLQLGYENQQRGTNNSMFAAGQGYSGARLNAQAGNDRSYAMNEAANRLAYQRGLHGIQYGQLNTASNNALGVGQGDFNALLKQAYPGT